MPYITIPAKERQFQVSFEDLLRGITEDAFNNAFACKSNTRTIFKEQTPSNLKFDLRKKIFILKDFCIRYNSLINTEDKESLYHSFKIPKRSGGWRQINAPNDALMRALRELKFILEKEFYASHHTSAFAYVKGRCTIDAVKKHQRNNSRWFLKLDFSDFFGSTTLEFVMRQLETIYPFNLIIENQDGKTYLEKALSLSFLNGGLPQGTPISPTITNLMMIPIDHVISNTLRKWTPHLVYTRYADDILLSSDLSFEYEKVQNEIVGILSYFDAPFKLNVKKTRYGSSAGRNWNLGVMLNKDNQITIGYKRKKVFKAMLYSLINDYKNGNTWDIEDAQSLNGLISYYTMVEKEAINKIIEDYNKKFDVNIVKILKATIAK